MLVPGPARSALQIGSYPPGGGRGEQPQLQMVGGGVWSREAGEQAP